MSEVETVPLRAKSKEMKEVSMEASVSKEEVSKEDVKRAFHLIAQGKRNIMCEEIPEAVNRFQEATKILAGKYGETSKECGNAYLCYGKALLDMSRMEAGVLGNALDGIAEDEDEGSDEKSESSDDQVEDGEKVTAEEREKISIQVYDAMEEREDERKMRKAKENEKRKAAGEEEMEEEQETENIKEETKKEGNEMEEEYGDNENEGKVNQEEQVGTAKAEKEKRQEKIEDEAEKKDDEKEEEAMETEEEQKDEDTATEAESEEMNTEAEAEGETGGKEGEENKEEEEEVSNLQLAWEVLELARNIFKERDTKEAKLKLADAHLKLGEVSLETEQFDRAVGDFKECLAVQQTVLEEDDRWLAETHYQLGVAYSLSLQYEESIDSFMKAQTVMEAKIKNLEKVIEEDETVGKRKDTVDSEDPVYKAHKEIKDLKELLPEVITKIEDVQEEQKTAVMAKAELKAVGFESTSEPQKAEGSTCGVGEGSSSAAVISYLLNRHPSHWMNA